MPRPKKTKAQLRLDSRRRRDEGGRERADRHRRATASKSLIVRRLLGLDGEDRMPKDGDPLPAGADRADSRVDRSGCAWAGRRLRRRPPANADRASAAALGVSRHRCGRRCPMFAKPTGCGRRSIGSCWRVSRRKACTPSPEAPLETLVRRVSLDLIGLPPSPQEVDDVARGRRAATASRPPMHGWSIDCSRRRTTASGGRGPGSTCARYADSHGFEKDLPRVMWKYRDWVIDALNRDMPFDQFTIEQIAGDMLPNPTTEQLIASGFHRNAMTNEEGGIDPEEAHVRGARRSRQHNRDRLARDDARLRAVPRSQVRPVHAEGLLPDDGVLPATATTRCETFGDGTRFFEPTIDVPTPRAGRAAQEDPGGDRSDATSA